MASLGGKITPIWGNSSDDHPVAWAKLAHLAANSVHDAHRLMAERQIGARADGSPHSMRVRGTDERPRRAHNGIVRAWLRHRLLHETHLTNGLHHKGFHDRRSCLY
jgi:hypothetical protein